jgi:hypothetical protein
MKITVQIYGGSSTRSICESALAGTLKDKTNEQIADWLQKNPLTFIAYSDSMKARVLENFLKSPLKIGLTIHDGEAKDGEWHELANINAVFNR